MVVLSRAAATVLLRRYYYTVLVYTAHYIVFVYTVIIVIVTIAEPIAFGHLLGYTKYRKCRRSKFELLGIN